MSAYSIPEDPDLMLKLKDALSRKMVPLIDVEVYQDGTISPQTLQLFQATRAEIRPAKPSSQLETGEGLVSSSNSIERSKKSGSLWMSIIWSRRETI